MDGALLQTVTTPYDGYEFLVALIIINTWSAVIAFIAFILQMKDKSLCSLNAKKDYHDTCFGSFLAMTGKD